MMTYGWILFASALLSALLALLTAGLMIRMVRVARREYLLGFPAGFGLLGLAYLSFSASYLLPELVELTNWIGLVLQSYGFAFVAATYLLKGQRWRHVGRVTRSVFSFLVILAVGGLIVVLAPLLTLPTYTAFDEGFRLTNVVMLVYILSSLYYAVRTNRRGIGTSVLASFLLLAWSQYSYLIWGLDGGFWSFAFAHLLEILGLAVLVYVLNREFRR
jgi:hypothetical protein